MIKLSSVIYLSVLSLFATNQAKASVVLECPSEESKISECIKLDVVEETKEFIIIKNDRKFDLINLDVFDNNEFSSVRVDRDGGS